MIGQNFSPIITVIMPVFNTEKFLREAIDSVLSQSFNDWELICVNDGSTDNSLQILKEYEASDKRIRVFNQKNSGSAAAARNKALDNAKGEFIQMLDSDDLFGEHFLQKMHEKAVETNADFVISDLIFFENTIDTITLKMIGLDGDRTVVLSSKQSFIASLTWKISGVGLYRAELLKKFKYDETGLNGDEYSTRLLLLNCNKVVFSDAAYLYRKHEHSTTSKISVRRFETLLTDFRILDLAYQHNAGDEAIKLSKIRIVENLMFAQRFYLGVKKNFNKKQKNEIENLIKKYYQSVDKSFITYQGNLIKYAIRKFAFLNFKILNLYSYGFNLFKFLINSKY